MTELFNLADPEWIIDRHIAAHDLALIYGPPGEGKTFKAIDWSLSIAAGVPLYGKFPTKKKPIVYVISEGISGFKKRVRAWCNQHAFERSGVDIHFVPHSFSLVDPTSTQELIELIRDKKPGGVFIDTVARNFAPGDENSTKDMSQFVACCDMIRDELNCFVCLIHHSGKNKAAAERGSNALRAAVDFSIEVSKPEGEMMISCRPRKCKEFVGSHYVLEMVPDEETQSCTLRYFADGEAESKAEAKKSRREDYRLAIRNVLPGLPAGTETDLNTWTVDQVRGNVTGLTERVASELLAEMAEEKAGVCRKRFGSHGKYRYWVNTLIAV